MTDVRDKPAAQIRLPAHLPQLPATTKSLEVGRSCSHFDRHLHSTLARLTGGVSPYAISRAWGDWAIHTARAPGRQAELLLYAMENTQLVVEYAAEQWLGIESDAPFKPQEHDPRFDHPGWEYPPFSIWKESFLAAQDWWKWQREISGEWRRETRIACNF